VKGKKVPVAIYELRGIGLPSEADARAITAFETALHEMIARNFDAARAHFDTVLQLWPDDSPTREYLLELDGFRDTPPPSDWDGVVTMKTK
jgi:adenylate cyclase